MATTKTGPGEEIWFRRLQPIPYGRRVGARIIESSWQVTDLRQQGLLLDPAGIDRLEQEDPEMHFLLCLTINRLCSSGRGEWDEGWSLLRLAMQFGSFYDRRLEIVLPGRNLGTTI